MERNCTKYFDNADWYCYRLKESYGENPCESCWWNASNRNQEAETKEE